MILQTYLELFINFLSFDDEISETFKKKFVDCLSNAVELLQQTVYYINNNSFLF